MQEQIVPGIQTQEGERVGLSTIHLLSAYLKSEEFESLSQNKKSFYKKVVTNVAGFAALNGILDINQLPILVQEYSKSQRVTSIPKQLSVIKKVVRWGVAKQIIEKDFFYNYPEISIGTKEHSRWNVSPLTDMEINELMDATGDNLRDRALMFTIMVARTKVDEIRKMTKGSITTDKQGHVYLNISGQIIPAPEGQISRTLKAYTDKLEGGPLFPSRGKGSKSITRQDMHQRFQVCKAKHKLPELNQAILVRTGIELFGKPPQPVRQH